jgi:hypothetical protein
MKRRNLPLQTSIVIWFAAFLSPASYVLAVMWMSRLQVSGPPAWFVFVVFCFTPLAALMVCSAVAWFSQARRSWRVGWVILTILAIPLQFGFLFVLIASAITAAISLP